MKQFFTVRGVLAYVDGKMAVNSGGTRVTAADEAFAGAANFNLRHHVHVLRASPSRLLESSRATASQSSLRTLAVQANQKVHHQPIHLSRCFLLGPVPNARQQDLVPEIRNALL